MSIGAYALIMPKDQIIALRDKFQGDVDKEVDSYKCIDSPKLQVKPKLPAKPEPSWFDKALARSKERNS